MSRIKDTLVTVSIAIFITSITVASDWRENAKAIDISGGEDHTLVLTKNKASWACGDNGWYQLGIGNNQDRKTLVRVLKGDMNSTSDYLQDINDVDAGWKHSLALDVNGLVWSWGDNREGQLGDNQTKYPHAATPVQVVRGEQAPEDPNNPDPNLARIIAISAGRSGEHSLAVDANGYAYAWGRNQEGECGNGLSGSGQRELTPVHVDQGEQPLDPNRPSEHLNRIIAVSAGEWHSMALESYDPCDPNMDGRVYTWGDNTFVLDSSKKGVLGNGSSADDSNTPVCVRRGEQDYNEPNHVYLKDIVAISAGWDHSMAVEKYEKYDPYLKWLDPNGYTWPDPNHRGRVYTWGNNDQGWGDDGDTNKSNGGRLGNGSATDGNSTPVLVLRGEQPADDPNDPYAYLSHIVAVSAGEGHSMALDVNGYVYTWGDNQRGQLGNNSTVDSNTPVQVWAGRQNPDEPNAPLSNIVAISAGYWHNLAIDADGVVWVWGKTKDGRLGLADMAYANPCVCHTPHRIPVVYDYNDGGVGKGFAFSIEDAIDDANANDVLVGSWGIYYENVDFKSKSMTLESEDPEDAEVVGDTIINAIYNKGETGNPQSDWDGVDFCDTSGAGLAGFTLIDANECGVVCINADSVYISNCVIQGNGGDGIYVRNSSVDIRGCDIRDNCSRSNLDYCGIYTEGDSDVNVVNCVIADNDGNGITCKESSALITNSTIYGNEESGIKSNASGVIVHNCMIKNNKGEGISNWYSPFGSIVSLTNNIISGNNGHGIYSTIEPYSDCEIEINNNWIYGNGADDSGDGIHISNTYRIDAVIRNNTVVDNSDYGIHSDYATDINVSNCIVWGNGNGSLHKDSEDFDNITYSCIEGGFAGTGNINSDPCFYDADANDFHLDANSLCIDAGDPGFEADANETDIDGEERVVNERVDMGADEFYWSAADYSGDGIVNFIDYAMLTSYWQDTVIEYNDVFGFGDTNSVSLEEFCNVWLWEAAWLSGAMPLMAGRSGEGMVEGLRLEAGPYALAAGEREPPIAEPVDVEKLLDWLAEIWLDPEVRKTLDADAWLKLYESLKEL